MDATLADPLVGRVLDGRYRVEARLARGGMATVYTAVDTRLDRLVAVKVMSAAFSTDPDFVARFRREARAAARLSHPNVVAVYDQGSDGDMLFLVLEYVPGRTLRDLLRERGPLSPARALELLEPVLAALGAAHAAGYVHRDVKPENVLLSDEGRVKVADFGLARAVEAASATASVGMLLGTVHYLAPEQVATGASDARSDVYAAGVLLYELLTGSPPFDGETPMSVAFRHVHEDVPAPSRVLAAMPEPIDDLVAGATARDPAARFADAYEFLGAVRRVRALVPAEPDTASVAGPPPGPVRPAASAPLPADPRPTLVADLAAGPPRRATRGRRRLAPVLIALLAAAAAAAGWWMAAGRYADVPGVVGLSPRFAEQRLAAAGLRARWAPDVFDATIRTGLVAVERPRPGGHVPRGGTVTLALSKGPEMHVLDDLRGRSFADARDVLAGYRLRVAQAEAYHDAVPTGAVVRTDPPAGTTLHPGDLVTVYVSKGPQPVKVPDVTGKPGDDATKALRAAGFAVDSSEGYSDDVPRGAVVSQDPRGGTADHGSTVTLVVSKGPQLFAVPNVHGFSVSGARARLAAAGFRVRVYAPFGFGTVHAQSPGPAARRPHGTTVTIIAY